MTKYNKYKNYVDLIKPRELVEPVVRGSTTFSIY